MQVVGYVAGKRAKVVEGILDLVPGSIDEVLDLVKRSELGADEGDRLESADSTSRLDWIEATSDCRLPARPEKAFKTRRGSNSSSRNGRSRGPRNFLTKLILDVSRIPFRRDVVERDMADSSAGFLIAESSSL